MKKIIVDPITKSSRKFLKYFRKYVQKKGYNTPVEDLVTDILVELVSTAIMSYAAIDLDINEEFELQLMDNEDAVFKCKKVGKYELVFDKNSIIDTLEIDKNDPMIEVLANPANYKILSKAEHFRHPLAEIEKVEGVKEPVFNGYAIATVIIDCVRNPETTDDNAFKATDFFRKAVLESGQNLNVEVLLEKIKAGHLSQMMKASTLINDGFHNIVHHQMKNK
jgi:hypothetical protein